MALIGGPWATIVVDSSQNIVDKDSRPVDIGCDMWSARTFMGFWEVGGDSVQD